MTYIINPNFNIFCGFDVNAKHIESALNQTIPSTVYKNIDYKTTSSIVGSMFCQSIAWLTDKTNLRHRHMCVF
jgi:hypothetical protein